MKNLNYYLQMNETITRWHNIVTLLATMQYAYHKIVPTTSMFTWYIIESMCLSNSELFCVDIPSCKHKDGERIQHNFCVCKPDMYCITWKNS